MQSKRVWARALGVDRKVVIEAVSDDDANEIVVRCRQVGWAPSEVRHR